MVKSTKSKRKTNEKGKKHLIRLSLAFSIPLGQGYWNDVFVQNQFTRQTCQFSWKHDRRSSDDSTKWSETKCGRKSGMKRPKIIIICIFKLKSDEHTMRCVLHNRLRWKLQNTVIHISHRMARTQTNTDRLSWCMFASLNSRWSFTTFKSRLPNTTGGSRRNESKWLPAEIKNFPLSLFHGWRSVVYFSFLASQLLRWREEPKTLNLSQLWCGCFGSCCRCNRPNLITKQTPWLVSLLLFSFSSFF